MRACVSACVRVCVWLPEVWPREEQASSSRPDPRWSGDSVERLASSLTQEKTSCSARVSLVNTAQIGLGEYFSLGNSHFQKRAGCLPSLGWDLLIQKKKALSAGIGITKAVAFCLFLSFSSYAYQNGPEARRKFVPLFFLLKVTSEG